MDENNEEQKSTELINKANAAAERLEKANAEHYKILAREESIRVEKTLGGKTDANIPPPAEESPEDYAKKVMSNAV